MRSQLEAEVRAATAKELEAQFAEMRARLAAAATKEADLLKQQRELDERTQRLELDVERRLAEQTKRIREQAAKAAEERVSRDADDRVRAKEEELLDARSKLTAAASREADLLKKQREVAERQRDLEVDVERRLAEAAVKIEEQATSRMQKRMEIEHDQQKLREEEHRLQIDGLQKTIGELQRRVQQGSQQTQGEAQEIVLRDVLADAFPTDLVEDVGKGVCGADVLHHVRAPDGGATGAIVWESKRTKAWSDGWLPKLRDDQRAAGAACAVVVTQAMPPDVRHFGLKEGVWVCAPSYAVALGGVLRGSLIEVALAKRRAEGSGQKMQLVYEYLTGVEFRNRVEGLLEAYVEMREDLESEKRAMQARWKRRQRFIERAVENVTAFYGDLQGIAGRQLPGLPSLGLEPTPALPEARYEDEGPEKGSAHKSSIRAA